MTITVEWQAHMLPVRDREHESGITKRDVTITVEWQAHMLPVRDREHESGITKRE